MTTDQRLRMVANWVNLSTPLGLLVALVGKARLRRGERGLIFANHYRLNFPKAGAFTMGNVVLVPHRDWDELMARNPRVLDHEDAHAWQYAYCLGLPFLPAYLIATLWSYLRTGDRAAANYFERQAGLQIGGYEEKPRRKLFQR